MVLKSRGISGDSDRLAAGFTLPEDLSDLGNLLILMQTSTVTKNTPNTTNASAVTTTPTMIILSFRCTVDKLGTLGGNVDVGDSEVSATVSPPVILLLSGPLVVCALNVGEGLTAT